MISLKNLNGFLTSKENKILKYNEFKEKEEHISILKEKGLYPFQQSELFKQLIRTYDGQEPNHNALIETSIKHIQKHSTPELKENVIVLVHPFFLYLHHNSKIPVMNNLLTNQHIEDSLQYIENLQRVLSKKEFKDYSLIFFEEIDAYYQFSSSFLEKQIIDSTILTANSNGVVISTKNKNKKFQKQKKVLEILKGKNLFFGGGYAGSYLHNKEIRTQCLDNAIADINKQYYPKEFKPNIYIIEDLIMSSSIIGKSLFEHIDTKFYKKTYSSKQVLKLNDL